MEKAKDRRVTMPWSKIGAGPGHIKSRYGAKWVVFFLAAVHDQSRTRDGAHKKLVRAKWAIFYHFLPSLGPGHVKSAGQMGHFLLLSALVQNWGRAGGT